MSQTVPDVPVGHAVRVEDVPDPQVGERASRRTYTARYKLSILAEYERLDKAGKGALLRREGLYTSLITAWREQRDKGAAGKAPLARTRFLKVTDATKELDRATIDRARQLAGLKGYVTNLAPTVMDGAAVIAAYHDL